MRRDFTTLLRDTMRKNHDVYFLTGDLGYGFFENFPQMFPRRAFNVGASEQAMLDMAVGLAYEGKIPVVYSITPFLLYRPFETLRTYINHEDLKVILVGSGRDDDYSHDGFSHDAIDDELILLPLRNIEVYKPDDIKALKKDWKSILNSPSPSYLNLKR